MAIQWGSWEYSGGNGMRVGIDVSATSVSHTSSSCTVTFKIYTQNQYKYGNPGMRLAVSGTNDWSDLTVNNNDGSGSVKRGEKEYNYYFGANEYGAGTTQTVTMTVTASNTYNGVTPSKTVSYNIPNRPIERPHTISGVGLTRTNDSVARLTWTPNPDASRPYENQRVDRWDNISNEWTTLADEYGKSRTDADVAISANRLFRFRLRAKNDAGWSDFTYSGYLQTTPAAPSGASVSKTSVDSVVVRWTNGASGTNGYAYSTLVEEQVNGGAWTQVATVAQGLSSISRTGRSPGAVYAYRVRAHSTVGATTFSGYATTGTIQLQSPPAAPTLGALTRANDNAFTLNWTNRPADGIAPYDNLVVERFDNVSGAWGSLGTLGPTATSLTDTSTVANHAYTWRIAASNAAGMSEWAVFPSWQTRPADPSAVVAKAAPGGALKVTWVNGVSYPSYKTVLRVYKNGTLVPGEITLAAGETSYTLTGVDLTATYRFGVKTVSTVGYTSESAWVDGADAAAATVPNAPADLAPNGVVVDMAIAGTYSWTHNPSLDGSDQTRAQYAIREAGQTAWVESAEFATIDQFVTRAADASKNGKTFEWMVRTKGVHATWSPWSAVASFRTSTTPTVTINTPSGTSLRVSELTVVWAYGDKEGMPQASYEIELYDGEGSLLEQQDASGSATSVTMKTVIEDGNRYRLRLRAEDGDGLKSSWIERDLTASFTPPAMPELSADYSQESGVTILTLTPTEDDGGVTTLPVTGVDVQRRLLDPATEMFGEWETLAEQVAADATLIDTTTPIANDGEYRIVAHSAAPSAKASTPTPPSGADDRWVYLSGGPNFTQVVRMMGNIALRATTSRDRELYSFAGRKKPVMFAGEARTRVMDVSGLLDGESSGPAEWEELISSQDVLLFRDPLGHRIYGSVPQVTIDNLGNEMYAISFTVTEVDYA